MLAGLRRKIQQRRLKKGEMSEKVGEGIWGSDSQSKKVVQGCRYEKLC